MAERKGQDTTPPADAQAVTAGRAATKRDNARTEPVKTRKIRGCVTLTNGTQRRDNRK